MAESDMDQNDQHDDDHEPDLAGGLSDEDAGDGQPEDEPEQA